MLVNLYMSAWRVSCWSIVIKSLIYKQILDLESTFLIDYSYFYLINMTLKNVSAILISLIGFLRQINRAVCT